MKTSLTKLFLVAGAVLMAGCGGSMEAEEGAEVTPPTAEEPGVSQEALPVCGSGLDCRGYYVSGSYTCVQYPGSTRAVYCCPSGMRVYYNDAGQQWCA
ncbi:hypothetical protein [Myxococcus sp. RHSTA-1-4]|uniref:hypothetical protein n=1 Tax=Myxococcus sp. RHSTA-1-4 TaxID=2874601 RepID=UPI001CC0664A|nr:hypothetical protein [Myxococcus sp. RHSTA-1-4]MBZ4416906.1 hypothetical protein [Myxococcus sp. RHSTA-1-4]